ncbi:hypothetical protein ABZ605_08315 [Streptomyces sp. NPDC012765]|uniref:hypothetical protein n=1 Tax=Streptomyces sp. NPDC012765 TaxID=3155249 RepID=UPI0033C6D837
MAYNLRTEAQIAGVWSDISGDVYSRSPVVIERGRREEDSAVGPSKGRLQLNNRDVKYSPDNPRSVNYGRIGPNTPIRMSVGGAESYFASTGVSGDVLTTPDHASLDIVGDIDVRVELTADWYLTTPQTLIGKWSVVDGNRSWLMRITAGQVHFVWSPTGLSAGAFFAFFDLPPLPRRAALRAVLDVNNGAGGWTVSFYWSTSLSGTWTLISSVTLAGVTSIYSGSAPLEIAPTQFTTSETRLPWRGRLHRAEVRSGIAGSVVASPDVRAKAVGTTSWADSAGRTWSVAGAGAVTNREWRLHAEVSSWPTIGDVAGRDIYVPVEAAGILRRLGQGVKPLASTLRRRIPAVGAPVAYWPLEEGRNAEQGYSPLPGVDPLVVSGFSFESDDTLPGSSSLPKIAAAATMRGTVPAYTPTGQWHVAYMGHSPAAPASVTKYLEFFTTGTAKRITFTAEPGFLEMIGYNAAGGVLFTTTVGESDFHGHWTGVGLTAAETGANVRYELNWDVVDGPGYVAGSTVAGTAGIVTAVNTTFGTLAADLRIGHLGVFPSSDTSVYRFGDNAWGGEEASARLLRLGTEESVPIAANYSGTSMGPQRPNKLLTLLGECAAADLGLLHESRDRLGLAFKARVHFYNQPVALTLDYNTPGEVSPPLLPNPDDQRIRNDRIVTRVGGTSARAVDETSARSINPPPAGVGLYDDSRTLNLRYDSQPEPIADWLLHMGTWGEARYPTVRINMAAIPAQLMPAVLALEIGDRIQIINPPEWLPPGPIDLIVEGYTETLRPPARWDIVLNCSPAGMWTVAVSDDPVLGRLDTAGSTLVSGVSSTATSLSVATTTGPIWTTAAGDLPFDIRVGGEVMTVTAISGASSPQTFTVTRSVNAVVKPHLAGADVRLAQPSILSY